MTDFRSEWEEAAPAKSPGSSGGDFLSEWNEAAPTRAALTHKPATKAADDASAQAAGPIPESSGPDATDQVLRSMVQNTGASIIAGWRGMSELAQGRGMEEAANAVNEELENR